tara:strand:- start:331 stop:675 length:345 start_codon:yes stop_codon:yes gene_type:complete
MPRKEVIIMRDKIFYEWDEEEIDENGNIYNHNHFEPGTMYQRYVRAHNAADLANNEELVLVYNTMTDRAWAYVDLDTGKLPEKFDNGRKVPNRFHLELARWVKLKNLPLDGHRS